MHTTICICIAYVLHGKTVITRSQWQENVRKCLCPGTTPHTSRWTSQKHNATAAHRTGGAGTVNTHTHIHLTALFPGLPRWAGTRKVEPIRILLKRETVSGSGISWARCKSAPCSRQITTPASHHSIFYRPDALPTAQPTASKHWYTQLTYYYIIYTLQNYVQTIIQTSQAHSRISSK